MTNAQLADKLMRVVLLSFRHAYEKHAAGESLDAILIEHDIVAAGSDVAKPIVELHQRAIRSACAAVDARVPLPVALAYTIKGMERRVQQMLTDDQ